MLGRHARMLSNEHLVVTSEEGYKDEEDEEGYDDEEEGGE